jgi:hypothetical protein
MYFILRPAVDEVSNITVEWDLSSPLVSTLAVCSLGEGQKIVVEGKAALLDESFFAVGSLQSYPQGETGGNFGIYWL